MVRKTKPIKCAKLMNDLQYVREIKKELKKYLPMDLIKIILLGCTDPAEIAHKATMFQMRMARIAIYAHPQIMFNAYNEESDIVKYSERLRRLNIAREHSVDIMPLACLYNERLDQKFDSIVIKFPNMISCVEHPDKCRAECRSFIMAHLNQWMKRGHTIEDLLESYRGNRHIISLVEERQVIRKKWLEDNPGGIRRHPIYPNDPENPPGRFS